MARPAPRTRHATDTTAAAPAPADTIRRALAALCLAWLVTLVFSYLAFPAAAGTHRDPLGALLHSYWYSPLFTVPACLALTRRAGDRAWWRENRWAFTGLVLLSMLLAVAVAALVATVIALAGVLASPGAASRAGGPAAGIVLATLWTGLPLWTFLSGLALGGPARVTRR